MKPKYKLKSIGAAFDALDAGLKIRACADSECVVGREYDYADVCVRAYHIAKGGIYISALYIHPDSESQYEDMVVEYMTEVAEIFMRRTPFEDTSESIYALPKPPATEEVNYE